MARNTPPNTDEQYPDSLGTVEHLEETDKPEQPQNPIYSIVNNLLFTTDTWKRLIIRTILISQVSTLGIFFFTIFKHPDAIFNGVTMLLRDVFPHKLVISENSEAVKILQAFKTQKSVVAVGINAYDENGLEQRLWVEPSDYYKDKPWETAYGLNEQGIKRKVFHESGECFSSTDEKNKYIYTSCPLEDTDGSLIGFVWAIYATQEGDSPYQVITSTKIVTRYVRKVVL